MNDRQREDALFRQRIRDMHDRATGQQRPRLINGKRPMIIIERAARGTTNWVPFASSKSPTHAESIVADGENDALYQYRIQPQIDGKPSACISRSATSANSNGFRVPVSRYRQR